MVGFEVYCLGFDGGVGCVVFFCFGLDVIENWDVVGVMFRFSDVVFGL